MSITRAPRLGLAALLLTTAALLTGCAAITPPPADETPVETPAASAGFVHEDTVAGYAITFPGEPEVQTESDAESGGTVVVATFSTSGAESAYYVSQAITDFEFELSELPLVLINSTRASGAVVDGGDIEALFLQGLPAFTADITMEDGTPGTVVVAGDVDGRVAYQLVVTGAAVEIRQAFFDSFELRG